jgi:putative lipoprotein
MKYFLTTLATIMLFTISACQDESSAESPATMATLQGEAFYRERKLLPPGAVLKVTLEDVSKMDVASTVIGETSQTLTSATPFAFTVEYPLNAIQPSMQYSLRATIHMDEKMIFTSTQQLDPFRNPQEPIRILLVGIQKSSTASHMSPQKHTPSTGLAVVSVNPLADLTNTYWKLTHIEGNAVMMQEKQKKEAFLQLVTEDGKLRGFAGCNNFTGSYEINGNALTMAKIAQTKKMCMAAMETESRFINALNNTAHFSIHEHHLTLLNSQKKPIAKFEAMYFN